MSTSTPKNDSDINPASADPIKAFRPSKASANADAPGRDAIGFELGHTSKPMSNIPCVILAGGKVKPELLAVTGQTVRALVEVNGKPLLNHMVDALKGSPSAGTITVIGDVPYSDEYKVRSDCGDFVGNMYQGLDSYPDADYVLICTSDLPFVTGIGVEDFINGARELARSRGAAMIYPIVSVSECYAQYPGVKRTALKLKNGEFTGGNLMLCSPELLRMHRDRIAAAYGARKSVVRLASILGVGTLARLLASQILSPRLLDISTLEKRVQRLLGCPVAAYETHYTEIATDLDRPSDFAALGITPPSTPH